MFEHFQQSDVSIVAPDGTVRGRTKALFDKKAITIPDVTVQIQPGDEIRRSIPNGNEETYDVIDPMFHNGMPPQIPAYFSVAYRKKGVFPQGHGGNYTVHVSGPNARVNIHSRDHFTNVVGSHAGFVGLRQAIEAGVDDEVRQSRLLKQVTALEQAKDDKPSYLIRYQEFMSSAADHVTVLAPFLPFLANLLR